MSSKVAFQVHYGDFYRITRDSYGVNLSALEQRQCSLDKTPREEFWFHTQMASREVQCESKNSFAYGSYRDFLGNKWGFLGVDAYK